jgi:hypothetical protein
VTATAPSAGATLYLSFVSANGGGTASVAGLPLTGSPAPFTANSAGHVDVSYETPSNLPRGGIDTIFAEPAANAAPSPGGVASYRFSNITRLLFSPLPIAPASTLNGGAGAVVVSVVALDAFGVPVQNAPLLVSFNASGSGATLSVYFGGPAIGATPTGHHQRCGWNRSPIHSFLHGS